jgi:hypothetical protein
MYTDAPPAQPVAERRQPERVLLRSVRAFVGRTGGAAKRLELGGERRDRVLQHQAVGGSRGPAEILPGAVHGQFERPLSVETRQFLGRARRSGRCPAAGSLLLLRFDLLGLETPCHASILRQSCTSGMSSANL